MGGQIPNEKHYRSFWGSIDILLEIYREFSLEIPMEIAPSQLS